VRCKLELEATIVFAHHVHGVETANVLERVDTDQHRANPSVDGIFSETTLKGVNHLLLVDVVEKDEVILLALANHTLLHGAGKFSVHNNNINSK